jgi:hypothetical protein
MRTVTLLFGAVVGSLAVATTAPSPSAAAAKDCIFVASGNPGCRIVRIRDGHFSVQQIAASGDLWLQVESADDSAANTWLVLYYKGTFRSASYIALGGSFGELLALPGEYLVELRTATGGEPTSGELLDSFQLTLRSG